MKHFFILLLLTFSFFGKINSQDIELFTGEIKLNDCKVQTPISLYYKTKDKESFIKKAKEYKDIQLVLLSYNKKTKTATYTLYYLVIDERSSDVFIYLETPEDHNKMPGSKQAHFLSDNPKNQRFYILDCLLQKMEEIPELKNIIKQQ